MDLERAMEFLLQQQAAFQAQSDARMTRIEENLAETAEIGRQTRLELRRAVRPASHAALEASMKAYFDSLRRGQNGHEKQ